MAVQSTAFLLLAIVLFLTTGSESQQCPLPSQSEISTSLRTYLISTGGESSTVTVNLQNYHFTCQAVAARDMYRSLSVAVQYTTTDSSVTSAVQYDQFQLECVIGSPNHYQLPSSVPFEDDVSPSLLTIPTRRDCQFCTGLSTGPAGLDTTANCFACSGTCLGVGQGACAAGGTTCCPFFNTDGSCTTACPTNYTGSSDTNYNCTECAIPCPSGHEPNTACDGCVPVHICVTNDPCQNGATCNIGTNSNTNYTCSCAGTFAGENCTECVLPCPLGHQPNSACDGCIPVHICLTSNPCQNGATCNIGTSSNTDYTCSCPPNYTGQDCDSTISQCTLSCPLGYAPNMDCTECVPVHICVTNNPCQNEATCTIGNNSNTDYTCLCPANYTGQNCEICATPCPSGYEPISTCTGECVPVHICITNDPCQNGATCNIGSNSNTDYTCSCLPSFTDKNCSTRENPCLPNPCQNGGRCSSAGVEYSCACSNSWRGTNCTECGVIDCAQCSQLREGCEMCNIGYSPDNTQCIIIEAGSIVTSWWLWVVVAVVPLILIAVIVTILIGWYLWKKKSIDAVV